MKVTVHFRAGGIFQVLTATARLRERDLFVEEPRGAAGWLPAAWCNIHAEKLTVDYPEDARRLRALGYTVPIHHRALCAASWSEAEMAEGGA